MRLWRTSAGPPAARLMCTSSEAPTLCPRGLLSRVTKVVASPDWIERKLSGDPPARSRRARRRHPVRPGPGEAGSNGAKGKGGGSSYGAKDITVLEGLEAVRKRPGMYIGSTGPRGLHHLVYEVVDNSVDEAIAGHAKKVTGHPSPRQQRHRRRTTAAGSRSTSHPKLRKPAAEVVLTTLHAGGKFGDGGGYKVSGGLHGVGVSVVNALSEKLHLEVWRDGHVWEQSYERGKPVTKFKKGRAVKTTRDDDHLRPRHGDLRRDRVRLRDPRRAPSRDCLPHSRPQGRADRRARRRPEDRVPIQGRHRRLRQAPERAARIPLHRKVAFFEGESEEGQVEVAMQWNGSYQESIFTFANNINTHEGGTHLSGFRSALTRTLNAIARNTGLLKEKDENLTGEDVREGLTAVVSVKLPIPSSRGRPRRSSATRRSRAWSRRSSTASSASSSRRTPPMPAGSW